MEEKKNEIVKEEKKASNLLIIAGLAGAYLIGFKAGQKSFIKKFRKECRRVDFGKGINLPLFYPVECEQTVKCFFEIVENELIELDKLRGGKK